ncbi:MAG: UDP-N-acetylmuramoyl-tripeptide--D-alanyl-D-alanine ligase [Alphaproteobacteria bacterium]
MPELWNDKSVAQATSGKAQGSFSAQRVEIDSRKVQPGDLFVAICGEVHDGHKFIPDAKQKGAVACLVSKKPDVDIPYVLVKDTLEALTNMARKVRHETSATLVGITGSVGKTSSKEMMRLALNAHGRTYATQGNYNNHIGLPLCLANMPADTEYAVIEMGMNHAGEIAHLSNISQPHLALITAVEAVHIEFFDTEEGIADAKAEIFEGMAPGAHAVLNKDNKHFLRLARAAEAKQLAVTSVGTGAPCHLVERGEKIEVEIEGKKLSYRLPSLGHHMAYNSLLVLACIHALGLDVERSARALEHYREPKGRGGILSLRIADGCITLIDDSYNASPVSMRAAFSKTQEYWESHGKKGRKIAVLGDMLELGKDSRALHESLARDLGNFDLVFAAGEHMYYLYAALPPDKKAAHAREAVGLLPLIETALCPDDVLLVKGSNGSQMHRVTASLAEMFTVQEKKNAV